MPASVAAPAGGVGWHGGRCYLCSYSTFSSRASTWTKGLKLRSSVGVHMVGSMGKLSPSKHCLQSRGQPIFGPKDKVFKVSSFKGNAQSEEVEGREGESKFSKKPVHLSCSQQEREESLIGSSGATNHPLSYASEDSEGTIAGSKAIQRLFKKWLVMLRTQTLSQTIEIYRDKPGETEGIESQHGVILSGAQQMLKATFLYFMQLDAAIKVPPLIFIPWYLTVRVIYGTEVTRELTPLWILGPLIVALYVKIVQGLCSLYLYCFKQTVRLLMNLPSFYSLVYKYIVEGKLNAFLDALFWQPLRNLKNTDYNELLRRQLRQRQEWAIEKYLDYRESVWPYYCRTIRFLKRANLI